LERLGVEHIAAYSPQARGRSERVFHTLQDRLVKELALKEIDTVEAANLFLCDVYIPNITPGSRSRLRRKHAFVRSLASTLRRFYASRRSVRSATIIACRSTGSSCKYRKAAARHFVKTRVKVRQYPDGTHAIFYGRDALDATIKRAFSMKKKSRLNPLAAGCGNVDKASALTQSTGEQKQKKRTFDVLPNPAKLISYRQLEDFAVSIDDVERDWDLTCDRSARRSAVDASRVSSSERGVGPGLNLESAPRTVA